MKKVAWGLERMEQTETWNVGFTRAAFVYAGKYKGVRWKRVVVRVGLTRDEAERFVTARARGLGMAPGMFEFSYETDAL